MNLCYREFTGQMLLLGAMTTLKPKSPRFNFSQIFSVTHSNLILKFWQKIIWGFQANQSPNNIFKLDHDYKQYVSLVSRLRFYIFNLCCFSWCTMTVLTLYIVYTFLCDMDRHVWKKLFFIVIVIVISCFSCLSFLVHLNSIGWTTKATPLQPIKNMALLFCQ